MKTFETFETFLTFIKECEIDYSTPGSYNHPKWIDEPILVKSWESGGMTGGSCWGTMPYPYEGEPEPDFTDLDFILEKINPDIKYLEYKRLSKTLDAIIQSDSRKCTEYYGNYIHYELRYLKLEDLYKLLINFNWISNEI